MNVLAILLRPRFSRRGPRVRRLRPRAPAAALVIWLQHPRKKSGGPWAHVREAFSLYVGIFVTENGELDKCFADWIVAKFIIRFHLGRGLVDLFRRVRT